MVLLDQHHEQTNTLVQIFLADDDVSLVEFARVALLLVKHKVVVKLRRGRAALASKNVYEGVGDVIPHPVVAVVTEVQPIVPVLFTILFRERVEGDVGVEVKCVAMQKQTVSEVTLLCAREQLLSAAAIWMDGLLVGVLVAEDHLVELVPRLGASLTLGLALGDGEGEDLVLSAEGEFVEALEGLEDLGWGDTVCYVAE